MIATYALNLFDLAATTLWVNVFGLSVEGNPIGRWLYECGLVYPTKIIAVGILLMILYFAIKAYPRWYWISPMLLVVYTALAIYHVASAVYISQII